MQPDSLLTPDTAPEISEGNILILVGNNTQLQELWLVKSAIARTGFLWEASMPLLFGRYCFGRQAFIII